MTKNINLFSLSRVSGSTIKARKTKAVILKAAYDILTSEKYHELCYARISKKSGLSIQNIAYYYSSINDILIEMTKITYMHGQKVTEEKVNLTKNYNDKIISILDSAVNWVVEDTRRGRFFLAIYYYSSCIPEVRKMHNEALKIAEERIKIILLESFKLNDIESIELIAQSIHSLLVGSLIKMISINDYKDNKKYIESSIKAVQRLLETF